jgi:hypothetical protein
MPKHLRSIFTGLLFGLIALCATAIASATGGSREFDEPRVAQLTAHVGEPLFNAQGEPIGFVEQLARDLQDDTLLVVVSSSALFDIGVQRVVLPAEAVETTPDGLRTDAVSTERELRDLPAFEADAHEPVGEAVQRRTYERKA